MSEDRWWWAAGAVYGVLAVVIGHAVAQYVLNDIRFTNAGFPVSGGDRANAAILGIFSGLFWPITAIVAVAMWSLS